MNDLHLPKFKLTKGGKFLGWGTSPANDWKIIFISALIIAVLVLSFCAYYFVQIHRGDVFMSNGETITESTFNLSRLRQTLEHYEQKSLRFEEAKSTPEEILDPSL